ncbi:MAG: FkbM family methyltransferase [Pseudomonadota bacterium]|nr:MAG: FkbM family methyltransferase [Pseudomonadota bacterium]
MKDWLKYRVRKKLHSRLARAAAACVRAGARLRRALGLPPGPEFVLSRYGVRMRANWGDRTFQYCRFGVYGRVLADFIATRREDFVFLDIGANQGLYSLLAAKNPHCRAIVALEPVAHTFGLLTENVNANGGADRTTLLQAALGERPGTAQITVSAGHSGAATLAQGNECLRRTGTETVRLIDVHELDRHVPDSSGRIIAKVDVEGYEHVVLAGLVRSRHVARIDAVFYEVDTRWSDGERLRATLAQAGFTSFTRLGRRGHHDVLAMRAAARPC